MYYCLILSNSRAEAMLTFRHLNKNASNKNASAVDVTCLTHEWETRDREYWHRAWRAAIAMMPCKIMHHTLERWEIQEKGTIPLPVFIKERAKNRMCQTIDDGQNIIIKKITTRTPREYGRIAALASILGYITTDGKATKRPRANCCALASKVRNDSRPRSARTRRLLASIPKMTDEKIRELLETGRRKMKHHGRNAG